MLSRFKERVESMLSIEARIAHKAGLTPNMISLIGIIFASLAAVAYARWQSNTLYIPLGTSLLILSGFFDALDGVLARLYNKTTAFGGFLDSFLDRFADALVLAGIVIGGLCDSIWGIAALIGSMLVSYTRARAEAVGVAMESIGLAERAERIVILAAGGVISTLWQPVTVMNACVILIAIFSYFTVAQRSFHVYKKLNRERIRSL